MYTILFYLGIILSLISFVFPLLRLGNRDSATRKISYLLSIISSFSFLIFAISAFGDGNDYILTVYNSGLIDFSFFIDQLSSFFIAIIAIVSLSCAIYSIDYGEHLQHEKRKNY